MLSTSLLEIKCKAIETNVHFTRQLVGPKVIISAVIKGNAYGHGVEVAIPALEYSGVNHFAVFSSSEARKAFKVMDSSNTLMIMGFIFEEDLKWIIQHHIEFYISNIEILIKAIDFSKALKIPARIHIDVETGMNRTGLLLKELKKVIPIINENKEHLMLQGLTSHLAGAESIANYTRIKKQLVVFRKRRKLLYDNGIKPKLQHIASSAATISYPDTRLDMVRTGVLLYGYWPTKETFINYIHRRKDKSDPLKRAIIWRTQVMETKTVPEGEFIGYGLSFQAQNNMKIMIVPVGYCNGYSRSLSNNGHVLVKGQRAHIIGGVNMNMILCDISMIKEKINIGDEVVLIGQQGNMEISFTSFADMNNSLNYEILARLPENIQRVCTIDDLGYSTALETYI
ncbi:MULTISPECIES: alanine racemase [unclassified Lentimicrobium]|uniref:alanine racemase n=1 Tax=unclassified Lentimicrobium TaxID=2677434 RepID=UPI001555CE25|nr:MULTISPECIES: alanine racemase [unclassified Lentimicrobium]NPD45603.1 alanine racemase [Lentimicrobium sp. S6]NPD86322.1 alanine racemase [Lentimicrobium sp. L6]